MRLPFLVALVAVVCALTAAEPPKLTGTWVGDAPAIAADRTLVLAFFNTDGTC